MAPAEVADDRIELDRAEHLAVAQDRLGYLDRVPRKPSCDRRRRARIGGDLLGDRRARALIDRIGATRLLTPCVGVVVLGLLGIAHGVLYPAAIAVVIARALLSVTGPVLASTERGGSTVERLAAFATWVDCGAAVGPLLGGFAVARLIFRADVA